MSIISKIEVLFNRFFYWCIRILGNFIPIKIKSCALRIYGLIEYKIYKLKYLFICKFKILLFKLKHINEIFFTKAESLKHIAIGQKVDEQKEKFKSYFSEKSTLDIFKDFKHSFFVFFSFLLSRKKFISLSALSLFFFISFLAFNSYLEQNKLAQRNIANERSHIYRPEHQKFVRRTLKVQNISIPIMLKNKKDIHSFLTDFYIRTDTVFAKLYLDHNQHKIRDRFYETTYRMPASFPLDDDGKSVIKEKITDELNMLLKENKVEGKVLEVSFDAPIGN